jgi:hypothetical protein
MKNKNAFIFYFGNGINLKQFETIFLDKKIQFFSFS